MMNLGLLYKDNRLVNHRSLFKILLNPILRSIGYQFGSVIENNEVIKIKLVKCLKQKIKFNFKHNDFDTIIKKRRII